MTAMHRREFFRVLMGCTVAAAGGMVLLPAPAAAAPGMTSQIHRPTSENLIEDAVVVVRRRRRRVCWWHRGRRICRWRWV